MTSNIKKIFIIAGEPSGDLHGAKLIRSLRGCEPNSSFIGHGGDAMKTAGMEIIEHVDSLSIMGFFEVLKHLPRMLKIMNNTIEAIAHLKPDRIILIDYPGFNLRLAKRIRFLNIPITYFILPQAWAWKEKRVEKIKELIDQCISIFPFETEWFKSKGVKVSYFGHPFMDVQHVNESTKSFFERHGLNNQHPILTLLPGSRQQEVNNHWPLFIDTVEQIKHSIPELQIVVAKSSNVVFKEIPIDYKFEEDAQKAILAGTAALVCSGTATLECAIETVPMVVCYKLNPISWKIAKLLTKIKYTAIVNLIANERVVPECIQDEMNPGNLSEQLLPLLDTTSNLRSRMISDLEGVKRELGNPGVYERAAESILERMNS